MNLSPQDFMQMFTAEITNQDPLQPMNSSTFLTQVAQMTEVSTSSQLSDTLNSLSSTLNTSMNSQQLTQAMGLLGQTVQYTDGQGNSQQGTVSAIQSGANGAAPSLLVDGNTVALSSVTEILQQ
jgi:flagellar basal-body rod modification protein FlgD